MKLLLFEGFLRNRKAPGKGQREARSEISARRGRPARIPIPRSRRYFHEKTDRIPGARCRPGGSAGSGLTEEQIRMVVDFLSDLDFAAPDDSPAAGA